MSSFRKGFLDTLHEMSDETEVPEETPPSFSLEQHPLIDAIDAQILMHRDVHFGGRFEAMILYYEEGGWGVNQEFTLKRIRDLSEMEKQKGENLAFSLLTEGDLRTIMQSRKLYASLVELADQEGEKHATDRLIAELILSEEEEPEELIQKMADLGDSLVLPLVEILQSEEFRDPLYPGYGLAPGRAAQVLGRLKSEHSVIPLFQSLGDHEFFVEEEIVSALVSTGDVAREFLQKVVASRPITEDNEQAALVLTHFSDHPEVSDFCISQLKDSQLWKYEGLSGYLIAACEAVENSEQRRELKELAEKSDFPELLRKDLMFILNRNMESL